MKASGELQAGANAEAQAKANAQALEFQAAQLEQQAGQERAASQRAAGEREREARLLQSRALALSAASGAGAFDPSVVQIISELAGEGAYRAGLELYEGESKAKSAELAAASRRLEAKGEIQAGKAAREGYEMAAGLSLVSGAGSILSKKYGTIDSKKPDDTEIAGITRTQTPGLYPYA
jgi:hypothetical protein